MSIRLKAVAHIPHGSGDAEYHLVDAGLSGEAAPVLAIVDPNMILPDPAAFVEQLARSANSHDALVAALEAAERTLAEVVDCYDADNIPGNAPHVAPYVKALAKVRAALATAREG